jgi:predicted double-glycine peptidase
MKRIKIKRVKQKHETGCGIACVATLSNKKYDQVLDDSRELFLWGERKSSFYTSGKNIRDLLRSYGIESDRGRRISSWKNLMGRCSTAIVAINPHGRYWHWVVFIKEKNGEFILDPNPKVKTEKRTDFGRMRIKSFIPVKSA